MATFQTVIHTRNSVKSVQSISFMVAHPEMTWAIVSAWHFNYYWVKVTYFIIVENTPVTLAMTLENRSQTHS